MKNVVKISILMATITVAMVFLNGCTKSNDESEPLVSGSFNGTVTATVDGGAELYVSVVAAINDTRFNNENMFLGNIIGNEANFNNGSFTITLPTTGLSSYLEDVTAFFDSFMQAGDKGKLKVSDPSARVMDVDFIGFYVIDEDIYVSGIFSYATADKATICVFVYADSDVDITGSANVSVSLKQGWNRVYISDKLTTNVPDGMKWYFAYFE